MSKLLRKPNLNSWIRQQISPESAGWSHVGFSVYDLQEGKEIVGKGNSDEVCIVLLSGVVEFSTDKHNFGKVTGRGNVFEKIGPYALYVPKNMAWRVKSNIASEIAVCTAPGLRTHKPRVISPSEMQREVRGVGTNQRFICNILPETEEADSLLVVEVITPSGNWSSYPPHKHDSDNLPFESKLEETYYHRINPSQGYVLQKVYNDDKSLDETISAEDRDVVLVPEGYHPVGVPHGYESYYLNVMAGPKRVWKFQNDPKHEWIIKEA